MNTFLWLFWKSISLGDCYRFTQLITFVWKKGLVTLEKYIKSATKRSRESKLRTYELLT